MSVTRRKPFVLFVLSHEEAQLLLQALALARDETLESAKPQDRIAAGLEATRLTRLRERLLLHVSRREFQLGLDDPN